MDDGADGMAAVEEEEEESDEGEEEDEDEMETVTLPDLTDDAKYDAELDLEEEERMRKKYQEERMDEMFPDEIDTPMDVPARLRFQKYRGLKSFRTSPWDPKENLPLDYARIFQFGNFKKTRKRLLADERDTGAMPGWYVTVHITAVPRAFMESYKPETPVVIYGLLSHEQKMSVVNVTLKRHPSFNGPIKNKERMIFHVGYRRYANNPLYSQHTTGDKHKFERFLRMDVVAVATMYAPIAFPPASVLMFKENADGTHQLVATGSVMSVNPDRIITKRMVLSGHPYKINKRTSVIRYMFFNREDIYWFKPVELRTKYGRRGHIREPVGTHGHMKCVFDNQLKSQDTVLMNLYKRIFPKWTYDPHVPTPSNSTVVPVAMETADIPAMSLFD